MRIRTPVELGALIRDRRIALELDQKELAQKVGVSRQWIVEVEKGKPRVELALVLRTLQALSIPLFAGDSEIPKPTVTVTPKKRSAAIDLDSIIAAAREKRK